MSLNSQEARQAVERTSQVTKLNRLQPKARDYVSAFGAAGLRGDPKGKWEYKFPTSDDPAKQLRINEQVLELQEPWRRQGTNDSSERNAQTPNERLRDASGRERVVRAADAERVARKRGLKPVVRYGGIRLITDERGYLWRDFGRGRMEPTGHTHVGTPMPHVRAACEGCR